MSRYLTSVVIAATLLLGVHVNAKADPVSIACAKLHGGEPSLYFSIDVDTGVVVMDWGTFQATVRPDVVFWWSSIPRNLSGGGHLIDTYYSFDRATGSLTSQSRNECCDYYKCQRGPRPAPPKRVL